MVTTEKPRTRNAEIDGMVHSNDWHSVKEAATKGQKETALAAVDALFAHKRQKELNIVVAHRLENIRSRSVNYSVSMELMKHAISRCIEHPEVTFSPENLIYLHSVPELKSYIFMLRGDNKPKRIKTR